MTIPPKNLPADDPFVDFEPNDPNTPAIPNPYVPGEGPTPKFRNNLTPRGGSVVDNTVRRSGRDGGVLDTPNPHGGPRSMRPKRLVDTKFPTGTDSEGHQLPSPGGTDNPNNE